MCVCRIEIGAQGCLTIYIIPNEAAQELHRARGGREVAFRHRNRQGAAGGAGRQIERGQIEHRVRRRPYAREPGGQIIADREVPRNYIADTPSLKREAAPFGTALFLRSGRDLLRGLAPASAKPAQPEECAAEERQRSGLGHICEFLAT